MKNSIQICVLFVTGLMIASCGQYKNMEEGLYARIETNKGNILAKLTYKQTPMTVANFVGLAEGKIKNSAKGEGVPFYDGLTFHRVIPDFMIQGGDPKGNGQGGPGYSFDDEFVNELKHDKKGILSMANAGPGTNGSQFFITHVPVPRLDGKHTVFGEVNDSLSLSVIDSIKINDTIRKVKIIRIGKEAKKFDAPQVFSDVQEAKRKAKEEKEKALEKIRSDIKSRFESLENKEKALPSGLKISWIEKKGGKKPKIGDNVQVNYSGYLSSGKLFGTSSKDVAKRHGIYNETYEKQEAYKPFTTLYSEQTQLIPGFREGLLKMSIGDKALFIIPSEQAYGSKEISGIPPNSKLYFEVEIVGAVKK